MKSSQIREGDLRPLGSIPHDSIALHVDIAGICKVRAHERDDARYLERLARIQEVDVPERGKCEDGFRERDELVEGL